MERRVVIALVAVVGCRSANVKTGVDGAIDDQGDAGAPTCGASPVPTSPGNCVGALAYQPRLWPADSPTAIATADLDGDGLLDIVALSSNARVSVLLATSPGVYADAVTYPTGTLPSSLAIGDLDSNGKPDVVVLNDGDGTISVFANTGTGSLASPVTYGVGSAMGSYLVPMRSRALALADLDGDGRLDVVAAAGTSPNIGVTVRAGSGDGTFGPAIESAWNGDTTPLGLAVGDLDGDGRIDVVETMTDQYAVFRAGVNGRLGAPRSVVTAGTPYLPELADVNRDGTLDLVALSAPISQPTSFVGVFAGLGTARFATEADYPTTASNGLAIVDVNSDGAADLVIGGGTPLNRLAGSGVGEVLTNAGNGTFAPSADRPLGRGPLAVGDFDRDSTKDVVATWDGAVTWLHTGSEWRLPPTATLATTGDLDGDGKTDFVAIDPSTATVTIVNGGSHSTTTIAAGLTPVSASVIDLDGNGVPDLVVDGVDSSSVFLGHGDGTFTLLGVPSVSGMRTYADLNRDGYVDLISVTAPPLTNGSLAIRLGDGHGNFSPPLTYAVGMRPKAAVVADVNGDGQLDLVVPDLGIVHAGGELEQQALSIAINHGLATSWTIENTDIYGVPTSVTSLDVDGDCRADQIVSGQGSWSVPLQYVSVHASSGAFWGTKGALAAAGDLDGDGRPDLVVGHDTSGGFEVFRNDPLGSFVSIGTYPYRWDHMVLADLNGDGRADIVTSDAVILNNGDGTFGRRTMSLFANGVTPANIDGDGLVDLVGAIPNGIGLATASCR